MTNWKRRRWRLRLAGLLLAGGSLHQTTGCQQTPSTLAQDLVISIADVYITSYFNSQLNVPQSPF